MVRLKRGHTLKPIPICLSRQKIPTEREVKVFTSEQFLNFNRPDNDATECYTCYSCPDGRCFSASKTCPIGISKPEYWVKCTMPAHGGGFHGHVQIITCEPLNKGVA